MPSRLATRSTLDILLHLNISTSLTSWRISRVGARDHLTQWPITASEVLGQTPAGTGSMPPTYFDAADPLGRTLAHYAWQEA